MTNDVVVTTPVNVTGALVTNTVANHAEKLEKFNGQNFKRWQQKMFFYLGTLNLAWFLNETAPQKPYVPRNYALYDPNDMKTETMRDPTLDNGGGLFACGIAGVVVVDVGMVCCCWLID
ncbi:hypothetical protein Tco_0371789 [Tanacetum coccineum]